MAISQAGATRTQAIPVLTAALPSTEVEVVRALDPDSSWRCSTEHRNLAQRNLSNRYETLAKNGVGPARDIGRSPAVDRLEAQLSRVAPALNRLAGDPVPEVRFAAIVAIASFGPASVPAIPALTAALKEQETDSDNRSICIRGRAAEALGKIGPAAQGAVPELRKLFAEGDSYSMRQAAIALWRISGDQNLVVPTLAGMLDDANEGIRESAAMTLSLIGLETELSSELKARIDAARSPLLAPIVARSTHAASSNLWSMAPSDRQALGIRSSAAPLFGTQLAEE